MAFGDPINIDVTISGETNTIASFQGGETNVTRYSGGNNVNVTFDDETSAVTSQSGHNVEVTFPTGTSTSVDNAVYVIGGSSNSFSCSDLDGCTNLVKSVSGAGNIRTSANTPSVGVTKVESILTGYIEVTNVGSGVGMLSGLYPSSETLGYDALYPRVVLLLNTEESNGSTTFNDSSQSKHTITANSVAHSNAQAKFGSTSALFAGSPDYLSLPDSEDFNFGKKDFTIEAWIYLTSITDSSTIISQGNLDAVTNSAFMLWYGGTSQSTFPGKVSIRLAAQGGAGWAVTNTHPQTLAANRWYHVAASRNKGKLKVFIDGSATQAPTSVGGMSYPGASDDPFDVNNSSRSVYIGYQEDGDYCNAYIDGLRITKEMSEWGGRYIGEFSPPEAQFPTSALPPFQGTELQKPIFKSFIPQGNISISGDTEQVYISGAASAAEIEIKNKGAIKTSAVSSMNFNQGYSVTNAGSIVTIDSSLGISNLTAAQCDPSDVSVFPCEVRTASGIHSGQDGDTLYLRGLIGTGTVTVTGYEGNDNFIYISGGGGTTETAANIGQGSGIYSGTVGNEFKLKSISGLENIYISGDNEHVYVEGFSEEFKVSVANDGGGNKYYISNVTDGSHSTTSQVKQLDLNLHRGNLYKFKTDSSTDGHPFHIATQGNGGNYTYEYTKGVTSSRAQNGSVFYFKVPQDAPTGLKYNCGIHANMGGEIFILSGAGGAGGGGSTQTAANIGYGSGIYSGTISDEFKLRSLSGAGSVTITGHKDSTIIVSGSAGGGVTWTTPPPTHKNYAGTEGQISFDNQYYYVCIDTNEWRRVAISEW